MERLVVPFHEWESESSVLLPLFPMRQQAEIKIKSIASKTRSYLRNHLIIKQVSGYNLKCTSPKVDQAEWTLTGSFSSLFLKSSDKSPQWAGEFAPVYTGKDSERLSELWLKVQLHQFSPRGVGLFVVIFPSAPELSFLVIRAYFLCKGVCVC